MALSIGSSDHGRLGPGGLGGVRGYRSITPLLGGQTPGEMRGPVSPGEVILRLQPSAALVHLKSHQEGMGEARGVPMHCPV